VVLKCYGQTELGDKCYLQQAPETVGTLKYILEDLYSNSKHACVGK
jgi:hypothetical protein